MCRSLWAALFAMTSTSRVMRAAFAVGVVGVGIASLAAVGRAASEPIAIASWTGYLGGVAQDATSLSWCKQSAAGRSEIHILQFARHSQRSTPAECGYFAGDVSYVFAHGHVAWAGYEEVRCSDTHWAVYELVGSSSKQIAQRSHDCMGYGGNFRGLVTDGAGFFYAVTNYRGEDATCDIENKCTFRLAGGGVSRIVGGRGVAVRGFPPAAEIAAFDGLIAIAEPVRGGTYDMINGPVDFPRAATNGLVEVRRSSDASLVARFRPTGIVRSIALSDRYAVVLVDRNQALRIEWYDVTSGARRGASAVSSTTARKLSASGHVVVFSDRNAVRLLDMQTGAQRGLWRGRSNPLWLTVNGTRVVWGTSEGKTAHLFQLTLH